MKGNVHSFFKKSGKKMAIFYIYIYNSINNNLKLLYIINILFNL